MKARVGLLTIENIKNMTQHVRICNVCPDIMNRCPRELADWNILDSVYCFEARLYHNTLTRVFIEAL